MTIKNSLLRAENGVNYLVPFVLITSLFFLWGFAHSLLDVLNKHFQDILGISRSESGLVQFALYGGYALMAVPAGLIMKRFGYKFGILLGLAIFAGGAFLFIPAAQVQTFSFTLVCLFVIACGLTCLETAANPYTTVLGPRHNAERRINLSQSFNGLGWIAGPLAGGYLIFGLSGQYDNKFQSLTLPYVLIGCMVLLVAVVFLFTKLPIVDEEQVAEHIHPNGHAGQQSMWRYPHFKYAIVAQFLYVAAQTGINSFFINYVTETMSGIDNEEAAYILSFGGMGLFFIGRLSGSIIMKWVKPALLLTIYAFVGVLCMAVVIAGLGWFSVVALFIAYFCMSVMFPTIFALGIKDLGQHTRKASSYLVLGVAGGALCPMFMGWIADTTQSMAIGFFVPLACFAYVAWFGAKGSSLQGKAAISESSYI